MPNAVKVLDGLENLIALGSVIIAGIWCAYTREFEPLLVLLGTLPATFRWVKNYVSPKPLRINLKPLIGEGGATFEIEEKDLTTVNNLTNIIYQYIRSEVDAETYGIEWVLYDREQGKYFNKMGMRWMRSKYSNRYSDDRPLEEVDIKPGMELQVVRPKSESSKALPYQR